MELDGHMTHGVREQLARRIPEPGEAGAEGDKHTRASLGTLPPHFRTGVDEKAASACLERDPLGAYPAGLLAKKSDGAGGLAKVVGDLFLLELA